MDGEVSAPQAAAPTQAVATAPGRSAWRDSLAKLAGDRFLMGMVTAVVVASVAPGLGRTGGTLHIDAAADWGIFAIFFLHGIGLSTERLREGLARWRVHGLVQVFTFAIFPIIGLGLRAAIGPWLAPDLMAGVLYLCALPSTVSSSVAMTALARGDVAASIFNATLSTVVGVVLTPVLVSLLIGAGGGGMPLGSMIGSVATMLLLPFALGQALRPRLGSWFARFKPWTSAIDRGVILLLVFGAFSDSVAGGLWTDHGPSLLLETLALAGGLLALVLWLTTTTSRRLGFSPEDEITTVFCGSKKTLASGVPMAGILFAGNPGLGVIVLPLMFYHQLQLLVCSILARRYAVRAD